jgi:hypothetical protein
MELIRDAGFLEKVTSYLRGEISLSYLDDWIVAHLPVLVPPRRDIVSELAGLMQLWISESREGHRDEAGIRALVEDYLRHHETLVVFYGPVLRSSSANSSIIPMPVSIGPQGAQVALSLRTQP